MNDIVERLRVWSKGTEQQGAVVLSMALTEAADAIERLIKERDDSRDQAERWEDDALRLLKERNDAMEERDEARREVERWQDDALRLLKERNATQERKPQ